MDKRLQKIYDNANAEFWLQLSDHIAKEFSEIVREYLGSLESEMAIQFIIKDYKRWKDENPEAK